MEHDIELSEQNIESTLWHIMVTGELPTGVLRAFESSHEYAVRVKALKQFIVEYGEEKRLEGKLESTTAAADAAFNHFEKLGIQEQDLKVRLSKVRKEEK